MAPHNYRGVWYLVRYLDDAVLQISKKSHIKYKKGQCFIRYIDTHFYPGSILFKSGNVDILQGMVDQLMMEPIVKLIWFTDEENMTGNFDQLVKKPVEEKIIEDREKITMIVSEDMMMRKEEDFSGDLNQLVEEILVEDMIEDRGKITMKVREDVMMRKEEQFSASIIVIEDIRVDANGKKLERKVYDGSRRMDAKQKKITEKKKEFCIFCKSLKTQLARHFVSCHKDEIRVKNFLFLPLQSLERRKHIINLRKEGQFEYNCKGDQSTPLSMRRSSNKMTELSDLKICPNCKGYYRRLRAHTKNCNPKWKGQKTVNSLGKLMTQSIHPAAGERLKKIFSILRDDEVRHVAANDELIITCANRWAEKYRNIKDDNMIRARIRLLGRFIIEFNKILAGNFGLKEVFKPQLSHYVLNAINSVANLGLMEESAETYAPPNTARNLGHLLKKCVEIYKFVIIENNEKEKKEDLEDFCVLLNQHLTDSINKTVTENISEIKRLKNIELPLEKDILTLNKYVNNRAELFLRRLEDTSSLANYKILGSFVLVSLIIFNRRRPGETERLKICDFMSCQSGPATTDTMEKEYYRIFIRGKLGRTVKLYIDAFQKSCIECLLRVREEVGVDAKNPYVFGLPDIGDQTKYLRACQYFRQYSLECGVKQPHLLRATLLRKEVATRAANLELNDAQIGDLADFMGHAEKIHRDHYRVSEQHREVNVLNLLNKQQDSSAGIPCNKKMRSGMESESNYLPDKGVPSNTKMRSGMESKSSFLTDEVSSDERSTKNIGLKRKRTYWKDEEKSILLSSFEENIRTQTSPSLMECGIIKKQNGISKSAEAIKAFINNTIAKRKRRSCERLCKLPHVWLYF